MEHFKENEYLTIYSIVNKSVLKDKTFSSLDKLILLNITALCCKSGKCFATNRYFAEIFGVSKNTISTSINKLVRNNILISMIDKTQINISKRYLFLHDNVWAKNDIGITDFNDTSIIKNSNHNNKINNNKIIDYDTDGVMLWNGVRCESKPCSKIELDELNSLLAKFKGDSNV